MPGFDTTNVAADVGAPQSQQNPMQTIQGLAYTRNLLNQNRLFPLEYQQLGLQNTGLGISNATNQRALQAAQYATLEQALAQTQNDGEVPGVVARLVASRQVDPDVASNALGGNIESLSSPAIHILRNQALLNSANPTEVAANIPQARQTNLGGPIVTQGVTEGPNGVSVSPASGAATLQTTLTPEQEASPVNVVGPGGVTTRQPLSQFVTPTGGAQPGVAPPVTANPEATSRATAVGSAATQTYQYQGPDGSMHAITGAQLLNPSTGAFLPDVKDANGNPITDAKGVLQVSLDPQSMAQLNVNATNQADRAAALQSAYEGSSQRKALLQEMMAAQGDFRSGPGAQKWAEIVTEYNRITGQRVDPNATPSEQVFGKMAEVLAAQQRDTLGLPATNAGADAAQLAGPNTTYSPEANMRVIAQLAGNEDYLQAKENAWGWYQQHGGRNYNTFVQQFTTRNDPRVYWERYMTPGQLQQMLGAMTPAERAAYQQAHTSASRFMAGQ